MYVVKTIRSYNDVEKFEFPPTCGDWMIDKFTYICENIDRETEIYSEYAVSPDVASMMCVVHQIDLQISSDTNFLGYDHRGKKVFINWKVNPSGNGHRFESGRDD